MAAPTRIWTDVDYDKNGKQIGWLYLHHSVTRSAYGQIMIPIVVIKNGEGPTALFMAGTRDSTMKWMSPEVMKGRVTDLRVELVEGAGHWVQQERPDEVNAALIDFLKN